MGFTHLHVHTEYSLLDGSSKIKEILARAKELGQTSLAITDHGVMYGVIDFYKAALETGVKPIIGCEVYVAPGSRFEKEKSVSDERYRHLVLLAENNTGYSNLMKIVSKGFIEGFYYKPRVDMEVLKEYHEGIIALSACLAGEVPGCLLKDDYEGAKAAVQRHLEIFGRDNYFLELQDHGIPEQKKANAGIIRLSQETGVGLVCTNDVHYTFAEDAEAHDILLCIQTQKKVQDTDRMRYEGGQFYLKSEEEMRKLFPYAAEAVENTGKIAERCNVTIEFGHYKLPKFDVPEGYTAETYLRELCNAGLKRRYAGVPEDRFKELQERLDYELDTIKGMGFVDYFLIVSDFIKYGRDHGIAVGPGRGSAAGSIVSYTLGITNIDPIRYSLLFERFLNPERVTMPDIDVDFCFERRQEVIDYVVRKYGKDRVVQIVTFGTLQARGVLRDVGRALDLPYSKVDQIAKMVPQELGMTLDKAFTANPDFKAAYDSDDEVRKLIDMSRRLEGLPRHCSMHAAGVVIANAPADDYVPLSRSADDSITTQYTMTTLEELGLLKMDFLGLRTLTVIQDAVRSVNDTLLKEYRESHGGSEEGFEPLNIDNIDYNDKKVFELIASGKTEGIFQLESAGMKNFMKELKPSSMEDIIAGISLYRPGPMDFIPKYIRGKQEPDSITYDCEQLRPILEPTYGCIVYQEQVMQIVRNLAGYSFGRSDLVRRAMSKKKASVMEKERANFVHGNPEEHVPGCMAQGIDEKTANKIYDDMTDFAKYAFNKSHAAAYAVVAYQTAFLKCYYPVHFMAALMTSVIDNSGKTAGYINICRKMGINVLPPDVNEGGYSFTPSGNAIRYSLSAIKGVGRPVVEAIVNERKSEGPYKNFKNFVKRLSSKETNKRVIESLIKAGAFDTLPGNRHQLLIAGPSIVESVTAEKKSAMTGQMSLFELLDPEFAQNDGMDLPKVEDYSKEEILAFEKEVLGIYVSGHPLENYSAVLEKNSTVSTLDFASEEGDSDPESHEGGIAGARTGEESEGLKDGEECVIGGIVSNRLVKTTRSNTLMAFLTLEDMYGTVEVLVFPKDYAKYKAICDVDARLLIKGRVTVEEERGAKLICQKMVSLDEIPKELWIKFDDMESFNAGEEDLKATVSGFDGTDSVIAYCAKERMRKAYSKSLSTGVCTELLDKLKKRFGNENVAVVSAKYQWR
ncbi:MAG: DNA polymerase III subunit alpha [Lachnospiraceae bacterium]|nr:DNA polymerase III subunit alpha [Lachnospiraceae bacterium]